MKIYEASLVSDIRSIVYERPGIDLTDLAEILDKNNQCWTQQDWDILTKILEDMEEWKMLVSSKTYRMHPSRVIMT